jgi:hypothetical protein
MGSRPEKSKARSKLRLVIEWLEARELLTAPTLLAGHTAPVNLGWLAAQSGARAETLPPHNPTPHELARERFSARFSGSFVSGPGRFTDQALQTFIKGGGTSNAFLHGNLQMSVYTPVDSTGQTTGLAALIVKNVSNTGNVVVLDLMGDTQSLDRSGRPTRLNWTVDGASGGTFSNATGQGTLQILYQPGGKLPARALSAGSAGVIFRGSIETNGVTNILRS